MRSAAAILVLVLAGTSFALQYGENLRYQPRQAGYSEGIRTFPSTDAALDLVSALVAHQEPTSDLPKQLHAAFYLPVTETALLTVRELDNRYNYWLEKKAGEKAIPSSVNRFSWPTATVIQYLNTVRGPLRAGDLGALVRLGGAQPASMEQKVVPVALYQATPPQVAEEYRFTFKPNVRTRLKLELFRDLSKQPAVSQQYPDVSANKPVDTFWKTAGWPEGWQRLIVTFYNPSNNTNSSLVVRFYHRRNLELVQPDK